MLFKDKIEVKANVHIVGRTRGKLVFDHHAHNIWVNLGREYLAKAISPTDATLTTAVNPALVGYIGVGIGSSEQTVPAGTYPALDTDYTGTNTQTDVVLTPIHLERPVRITGSTGVTGTPGEWGKIVAAPPTFTGSPGINTVAFTTLFINTDINVMAQAPTPGTYPAVPLSECSLMLSDQTITKNWQDVYDAAYTIPVAPRVYQSGALRQALVAYHGFAPLTKTAAVSLQITWELQF